MYCMQCNLLPKCVPNGTSSKIIITNRARNPTVHNLIFLWLAIPGDKRMPLFKCLIYNSQQLYGWIQTQVEGTYFKASLWVFIWLIGKVRGNICQVSCASDRLWPWNRLLFSTDRVENAVCQVSAVSSQRIIMLCTWTLEEKAFYTNEFGDAKPYRKVLFLLKES